MLRILHIITTIERGGAENQLLTLIRCQVSQDMRVSVAFLKGQPQLESELLALGVRIFNITNAPITKQVVLIHKISKLGFDLVHTHLPRSEVLFALAFSTVPWITTRHNAEPFLPNSPSIISSVLSRIVLFRCSAIVAISDAVKKFLLESHEVGVASKLQVIYYGYSSRKTIELSVPSKLEVHDVIRLVTVSRLVPQKDIETMLYACKILKEKGLVFNLKIIGEGYLKFELQNLSRELELEHHVEFIGRITDPAKVLSNSDIFLLTSLYEGFGLVLLEAMQAKLPMVVCANEAVVEVLGKNYYGLTRVKDKEAIAMKIISLLRPELREEVISYLSSRLAKFSPELMSNNISILYRKIIKSK